MDFQEMLQMAREDERNRIIRESVPKFLKAGIPAEELCTIFRITPEELADIMDARSDPDDTDSE